MIKFIRIVNRIWNVIPENYQKKTPSFFTLSVILLVLDLFSIFLLIPLLISLLDQNSEISFLPFPLVKEHRIQFIIAIVIYFLLKNYIAISINKFQAKTAFRLGSEYSLLISKHYMLGNYLDFKKQKKSTAIKDVIFVANDFIGNVLLSLNIIFSEIVLLFTLSLIGFYYYFTTTIIVIVVLGLILYISKKYNQKTIEKINKTRAEHYNKNMSNLSNLLNGYLSIKSLDSLNRFLNIFAISNQKLNENYAILHAKRINISKQTEVIMILILCGIFLYVHFQYISISNLIVFLSVFVTLLFKAIPSINKLSTGITNLNSHLYALDILEEKVITFTEIKKAKETLFFRNSIELKDIYFYYEEKKPLFNKLNLIINKGDFIAIKGASGIGKTTLLNIIAKLIDPYNGYIYLDGVKIDRTNKYSYFNLITYLTQKPFIFEGTLLDNIVLNKKTFNSELLDEILYSLDLIELIENLPDKLETYIGTDATNLSGGQLQKLCIARALLQNPEILILDEATNNLDKETERKTLKFLNKHSKNNNITVVSVSHYLEEVTDIYNRVINLNTYEV